MTQDTNNQEWWEGVKAEFSQSGLFDNVVEEELDAIIYGRLAKVSQQSREDALKERTEEMIRWLEGESGAPSTYGLESGHIASSLRGKFLSSKQ